MRPQDRTTVGTSGTDSAVNATVHMGNITPGIANTLVLGWNQNNNHAIASIASPFQSMFPIAPEYDSTVNGASAMFEDGGAGALFSTDLTAKHYVVNTQYVNTALAGLGSWVSLLSSWKAPTVIADQIWPLFPDEFKTLTEDIKPWDWLF